MWRMVGKKRDGAGAWYHFWRSLIRDKEFIVLIGPSGCGKSTTLRMVGGLEEIRLALNPERIHFFDTKTELGV